MFILSQRAAAWWPVSFNQPDGEGNVVPAEVELKFVQMPRTEAADLRKEMIEAAFAGGDNVDMERVITAEATWLGKIAEGWRGISEDGEGDLPWTQESRVKAMTSQAFSSAITPAFDAFSRARRRCAGETRTRRPLVGRADGADRTSQAAAAEPSSASS